MTRFAASLLEVLDRVASVTRQLTHDGAMRVLTDEEIRTLVPIAEALGRQADAARIFVAGEIDDRSRVERGDARMSARFGCANAPELLIRLTGVSTATARERIRLARTVATTTALSGDTLPARFPALSDGVAGGRIGLDTASAISRTLTAVHGRCDHFHVDAAEFELVGAAEAPDPQHAPTIAADETLLQAKVWALVLDPDGVRPSYEQAMRKRGLWLGREVDGTIPVRGRLLPDVAEQFRRLLDAHLNPRIADRTASRGGGPTFTDAEAGDGPVVPEDFRTRPQKQHDVLASVLAVAARAADTPTVAGAPPTLLVTVEASELLRDDGVAFIEGTDVTVPSFVARQIACCGGIQRVVFAGDGRIVELGGPQRVFTAQQRRAIAVRDGGCVIPGCHVGATWCEVHHAVPHARGGPTHTDNGVLLCWFHHRTLEKGGWQVRMNGAAPETKAPHSMDPYGQWRPATGSMHRRRLRMRQRLRNPVDALSGTR